MPAKRPFISLLRRSAGLLLSAAVLAFSSGQAFSQLTARYGHTTTLLPDGNILIIGGSNSAGTSINTVQMYITTSAAIVARTSMALARSSHTATLLPDGRVLVTGGKDNVTGAPRATAEIFNPKTNSWANTPDMSTFRHSHTAVLLKNGKVLIAGGQNGAGVANVTKSCDIFDPGTGLFAPTADLGYARAGHTAVMIKTGFVFAAGGYNGTSFVPTTEIYNQSSGQWTPGPVLIQARAFHTATAMNNGNVLISGGINGQNVEESRGFLETSEIYSPLSNTIVPAAVLPMRNSNHTAILTPDGDVSVVGGFGNITTSYMTINPTFSGSQIITTLIPGAVRIASVNPASVLQFPLDTTLSREVSGKVVDGDIYFSTPSVKTDDMITFFNHPSTSSINGIAIKKGRTGPPFPTINLTVPGGIVYFNPRDASSKDIIVAGGISRTAAAVNPAQNAPLVQVSSFTGSITIPFSAREVGMTVTTGTVRINSGTIVKSSFYTLALSSGIGWINGASIVGDGKGAGQATINVDFMKVEGTITNTTTTVIAADQPLTGLTLTGLSLHLEYVTNKVDLTAAPFNFDVGTITVRTMIFSDQVNYSPSKNAWSLGEHMGTPPYFHTSLLLPNADNAIIGGRTCQNADCSSFMAMDTAYSYVYIFKNSTAESPWTADSNLNVKRGFHTSTLLPDGRILTAGGYNGVDILSSAEIYTTSTKKWKPADSMHETRSMHTATLLPNGNVLIAGGYNVSSSTGATAGAEIFYPDTGRWAVTSSMNKARQDHTATLLPDGNVLVTGGYANGTYLDSVEIYYTTAAAWKELTAMPTPRAQHTATYLMDGRVLITGGVNHVAGAGGAQSAVDAFDPKTNTWNNPTNPADLTTKRHSHTATLLRDGRVLVAGGDNGDGAITNAEIYDPAANSWTTTASIGNEMIRPRLKHTAPLLPNGKVLVIGGVIAGTAMDTAEGFDVDFSTWQPQGKLNSRRGYHTTVLTSNGNILNIGGYDGSDYLNTTERIYFSAVPDNDGENPKDRQPAQVTVIPGTLTPGTTVTLLGGTSNFYGITEASGGGGGSVNSSFFHPRAYLQSIDNPSGFMLDLTHRVYGNGVNTDWSKMTSSMTLTTPSDLPYGWYHLRVAANSQFSDGYVIHVASPLPTGVPANVAGAVISSTTIDWTWSAGTVQGHDGYAIYSSSTGLFISTSAGTSYRQDNIGPNNASSIKVGGYNLGGTGPLLQSSTMYTYAAVPLNLAIASASFVSATLTWNPNNNHPGVTPYELSMSLASDFSSNVSTPVPFNSDLMITTTTINALQPNTMYYFRVRAMNGSETTTGFSNIVSTITVGRITNLNGTPLNSTQISWTWDNSPGASSYNIYTASDVTLLANTSLNLYSQSGLDTNSPYSVKVEAVKDTVNGPVRGPLSTGASVYTLAAVPLAIISPINQISTGSLVANWVPNGNPGYTLYTAVLYQNGSQLTAQTTTGISCEFNGIAPNTKYKVSVYAVNKDSVASAALDLGTNYTLAQAPGNVRPVKINLSGATLEWSGLNNPSNTVYQVLGTTTSFAINFSTYIPFSAQYTKTTADLTGLLTGTTYYFGVMARNGDYVETAFTQAVPEVMTLAGPSGAPPGSVGGQTTLGARTLIAGTLPTGRSVTMDIPSSSFPDFPVQIAISTSAENRCPSSLPGAPIEVAVFSTDSTQPKRPLTLELSYSASEETNVKPRASTLVLARYNPVSNECLPLETTINTTLKTITASLNHFSLFQLMELSPQATLDDVEIYPNPYYPNRGDGLVTLKKLAAGAEVRIYTLSGNKVWEGTANPSGVLVWRAVNRHGQQVTSGIYLCVITSGSQKKIVKIAVER